MIHDAYFAGFFDADGAVGISPPRGKALYVLIVQMTQAERAADVLAHFQARFGGKVIRQQRRGTGEENWQPVLRWSVEAQRAEEFLAVIAPHLVVKAERVALALEFREMFRGDNIIPRGHGHDAAHNLAKRARIMGQRRAYYERMRALNQRGVLVH